MSSPRRPPYRFPWFAALFCLSLACDNVSLDAGRDHPHGLLPVDERNPVILNNDNLDDNWQGVYAVLFANAGGPPLAGIVVNDSAYVTDTGKSIADWRALVAAARASKMRELPDPVLSVVSPLVRPSDGNIDATAFTPSPGARLIVDMSARLALSYRPVVVATGGRLTDVALAYLMDHTVADRIVVVASLGSTSGAKAVMGSPNGELDPWADWIVTSKLRYVQVSSYYDQTADITSAQIGSLPKNPFGDFVAGLQPIVENIPSRDDQVAVLALGLPKFVVSVTHVALDPAGTFSTTIGPTLVPSAHGRGWLVTGIAVDAARVKLWEMLNDLKAFANE